MGNILAANVPPISLASMPLGNAGIATDGKMMLWKLTRTMKAAGWIYKSSGIGNAGGTLGKDTSGNPNNDLWNGYGAQIPGQSGSTADFTTLTSGIATLVGLTGMTASSVGRVLILSGAATATNNGVFKIVTFNSSTSVNVYGGAASDTNDTRINWQEMDSAAYVSGQTGTVANITTVTTGRIVTVTGLTGMTPLSINRYLTITGAATGANNGTFKILSYISATSVTIINAAGVASDANNGSIVWKEMDPLLENYPLIRQNGWLCMQGPSTLRIPITTASSGSFLNGENITQATTGAQGEVIGNVFDTVAAAGFLVVMPRVHGSGGGALGWSSSDLITGGISGATVTPSANPDEFTREVVFFCPQAITTPNAMNMWMQCTNNNTENASRFSVLQAAAGCTAVVPPGGGGTGNTFPTAGTMTVMGNTTSAFTSNSWGAMSLSTNFGYSHFMCADTTYDTGRSADGSFCGAVSLSFASATGNNCNGSYLGCLWTRCDAQEDGDVDPYVFYMPGNVALYSATSTGLLTEYSATAVDHFNASSSSISIPGSGITWSRHLCKGWRRRGFAAGDAYQNFGLFTIGHTNSTRSFSAQGNGTLNQYSDPATIINRNNSVLGEPIWVISAQNGSKMRKGIMRWARLVNTGTGTDLYQGGLYIQLSNSLPAFIVGPWDKRTPPIK